MQDITHEELGGQQGNEPNIGMICPNLGNSVVRH
jgi:hypothetical protein